MNRFQEPYSENSFKKTFQESSKSRRIFRTHASIYDGAFLWIYLRALNFRNISSIIDLRPSYIWVSENIEIFKVKLRRSKWSRLLQRIAFLVKVFKNKAFNIGFFFILPIYFLRQLEAFNCITALEHNFEVWNSSLNLSSIFTLFNFTVLVDLIMFWSTLRAYDILISFFV